MSRFSRRLLPMLVAGAGIALALVGCVPFGGEGGHAPSLFIQGEEAAIAILLLATIVSIVTQRLRIPYTVGLVLVGFGLSLIRQVPLLNISPDIILALLVPPLVFEAAFHLNLDDLRRDLVLVLVLAVPGVILTTLVVGGIVWAAAGVSLAYAMVFGALIAATDPVAVVALFRTIGAPKRLQVLLEGESLLNDGTAIVLFNLMLVVAVSGKFNLGESVLQFVVTAGGGLLVGAIIGVLVSQVIGRIDNYLIETTLTTLVAYGAYLIAEYGFGVSGVLAVVAAGLASGKIGPRGMSPTTRIVVFNFWEYAAFVANSFIFLIIGMQIDPAMLVENGAAIVWSILAVLLARAVMIFGLGWLGRPVPLPWKAVLFWGGLRGAISLALALSLSPELPGRSQIQAMAFGVVLFTLVVEGLTMKPLLRWSGIVPFNRSEQAYQRQYASAIALRAAVTRLKQLNQDGLLSDYTWARIQPVLQRKTTAIAEAMHAILQAEPGLHQQEIADAWHEALHAQRSTLNALFRDTIIPEETYVELAAEIDIQLSDPAQAWADALEAGGENPPEDPVPD